MSESTSKEIMASLESLKELASKVWSIEISDQQSALFCEYGNFLLEWNKKINLTSITEPSEIAIKHFLDSIIFVKYLEEYYPDLECLDLADLGTGAGFPGIPIKILRPELRITLLDSLAKRIDFLDKTIEKLNLTRIDTVHARAEELGRNSQYRGSFDILVARAVAELPVLLEYALPLLKTGGRFFAAKGLEPEKEIGTAQRALILLKGEIENVEKYFLASGAEHRSMVIVKKIGATPHKYPRAAGKPKRNPL